VKGSIECRIASLQREKGKKKEEEVSVICVSDVAG
jgi:hypothetical protein